jgi:hypothetical protein
MERQRKSHIGQDVHVITSNIDLVCYSPPSRLALCPRDLVHPCIELSEVDIRSHLNAWNAGQLNDKGNDHQWRANSQQAIDDLLLPAHCAAGALDVLMHNAPCVMASHASPTLPHAWQEHVRLEN